MSKHFFNIWLKGVREQVLTSNETSDHVIHHFKGLGETRQNDVKNIIYLDHRLVMAAVNIIEIAKKEI